MIGGGRAREDMVTRLLMVLLEVSFLCMSKWCRYVQTLLTHSKVK